MLGIAESSIDFRAVCRACNLSTYRRINFETNVEIEKIEYLPYPLTWSSVSQAASALSLAWSSELSWSSFSSRLRLQA